MFGTLRLALLCGVSLLTTATAQADPPFERAHAPRVYAVTAGISYALRNRLPLSETPQREHPFGGLIGMRYGWQVGGFGGAPSSLGFETDFLYQDASNVRASFGLLYGLFAKHALVAGQRARPFFSYGLGAGQIWVSGVEGRGIGHCTRVGVGVDVRHRDGLHTTITLAYYGLILRSLGEGGGPATNHSFHTIVIAAGPWFGR